MKEMKNGNAGVMIERIEATSCFLVPILGWNIISIEQFQTRHKRSNKQPPNLKLQKKLTLEHVVP